jgi:hypothetical protein
MDKNLHTRRESRRAGNHTSNMTSCAQKGRGREKHYVALNYFSSLKKIIGV